jgi:hypothetical protein
MLSTLSQSLLRLDRLRRGIAIFLLAFASFDMAVVDVFFPQICGDEQTLPSLNTSVEAPYTMIEKAAAELASMRGHSSQTGQDSHQSLADEDCFCCCSHIIPSPHINVVALDCLPQLDDPAITSLPLPHPHGPFHPPRLS